MLVRNKKSEERKKKHTSDAKHAVLGPSLFSSCPLLFPTLVVLAVLILFVAVVVLFVAESVGCGGWEVGGK